MQRVCITGDGAELSAAQVQPVALLLHELAAIAKRHGALSVVEGALAIEWREDLTARELRIRWIESGGPPPRIERSRGYGQTMIDAIAARQLRGRIDYAWDDTGLVATLAFPRSVSGDWLPPTTST